MAAATFRASPASRSTWPRSGRCPSAVILRRTAQVSGKAMKFWAPINESEGTRKFPRAHGPRRTWYHALAQLVSRDGLYPGANVCANSPSRKGDSALDAHTA